MISSTSDKYLPPIVKDIYGQEMANAQYSNKMARWGNLVDDDCTVEPDKDAGDDGHEDAPHDHEGPEEDGKARDGHADGLEERALTADEVVQQPLPALEEHVGALHQRYHRVQRYVHGQPQEADGYT